MNDDSKGNQERTQKLLKIILNGEHTLADAGASAERFLGSAGINAASIIIVLNGDPLPKDKLNTVLKDGDRIDVLHLAGGG